MRGTASEKQSRERHGGDHRIHPAYQYQRYHSDDFLARERTSVDLGACEFADEVIARLGPAIGDLPRGIREYLLDGDVNVFGSLRAHHAFGPLEQIVPIARRHVDDGHEHLDGQVLCEIDHEVAAAARPQVLHQFDGQGTRPRFEGRDGLWRERWIQKRPIQTMLGGVRKDREQREGRRRTRRNGQAATGKVLIIGENFVDVLAARGHPMSAVGSGPEYVRIVFVVQALECAMKVDLGTRRIVDVEVEYQFGRYVGGHRRLDRTLS